MGVFCFLYYTNDTKSCNASHLQIHKITFVPCIKLLGKQQSIVSSVQYSLTISFLDHLFHCKKVMNVNINSNLSACVGDNSEMVKVVNLAFFNIRNFLFETFMPNLVTLTCPSLLIMDKTQTGVFSISGYLVKSFTNKNYRNYRTSPEIDMERGPLT